MGAAPNGATAGGVESPPPPPPPPQAANSALPPRTRPARKTLLKRMSIPLQKLQKKCIKLIQDHILADLQKKSVNRLSLTI
jgi:hypothetical protein